MLQSTTDSQFEQDVLQSDVPVLVDFWAPWCGPCKLMTPVLEQFAAKHEGSIKVVKVNIDKNNIEARKFAVRSIPTLVLFRGGQAVGKAVGAQPLGKLEALLAA